MKSVEKNIIRLLLSLCLMNTVVFAAEEEKSLVVAPAGQYETIQEAIDAAASETDAAGWKIEIADGSYECFTVPETADGLTICAAENAAPVICLDGTECVTIDAENVTLTGLVLEAGEENDTVISANANGLNLCSCEFRGNEAETALYSPEAAGLTVKNCSFDGFATAISLTGNDVRDEVDIQGNSFTDCGCALDGVFTGQAGSILAFRNNTVTGSAGKRCTIQLSDKEDTGAVIANLRDNSLTYVCATLENMEDTGEIISAFSERNDLTASVFYDSAVTEVSAVPKTGDRSLAVLWAGCVLAFGAGVVALVRKVGKRQ